MELESETEDEQIIGECRDINQITSKIKHLNQQVDANYEQVLRLINYIKDTELYLPTYDSFDQYCSKEEFDYNKIKNKVKKRSNYRNHDYRKRNIDLIQTTLSNWREKNKVQKQFSGISISSIFIVS